MARDGPSRPRGATHASLGAALLLLGVPSIARADPTISIAATTLDVALTSLARQSGADIISTEPGLRQVRVRRIDGRMPVRAALDRLLAGTGYRAVAIDANSFRVVRAAAAPVARPARPARPAPVFTTRDDIVVTASKQTVSLLRFPGNIMILGGPATRSAAIRPSDMDDVARTTPVLQNTEFGEGRNKIFIRGIADSSFNGSTQSTASIYLDDVQLGYSGPEPAINLYDVEQVEVLEGPQGTLYGAGAIGGIIRLTSRAVNLAKIQGSAAGGITTTAGGALGGDLSAMFNLPLSDRIGVRLVGYRIRDGGYIDDPLRRLSNVNRTDTVGGRIAVRYEPGNGWSLDTGGLVQQINARDAQYAEVASGPLKRRSAFAQPFHNDLYLGRAVIRKKWDSGLELVSATGLVSTRSGDMYDATKRPGISVPTIYENDDDNLLLTHETRLSRSNANGSSWVAGIALLYDRDAQSRSFGPVGNPADIIGVTNVTKSASAFAEATVALTHSLSVTLGGRATTARTDGDPSITPRASTFVRGKSTLRVDPTVAVSWLVAPRLAVFARFQSGYRTGGIAVARGIGRVADFSSDSIKVGEVGMRMERKGATGLALSAGLSFARWFDIQADLFNRSGQPYTANIGNADIIAIEANGDWVPLRGLHASFAFLYTRNRVTGTLAASSSSANRRLPETPPFAGNIGLSYQWALDDHDSMNIGATARYVGRSVLGTGDFLDISQGRYTVAALSAGWKRGHVETSLTVDNLTNARDNRFSLGNPIILGTRDQTTPLRPRNIRLGVAIAW